MKKGLTKEIAYNALQDFFSEKPFVLFGTGPSMALDEGFGMSALRDHLCGENGIQEKDLTKSQKKEWANVIQSLAAHNNLETAMDEVKDDGLIKKIIRLTTELLVELNNKSYGKILSGDKNWPALPLFKRLVDGLPETDRVLHVATTNYDLLAEVAFEKGKIPYITGFCGNICRRLDWEKAGLSMTYTTRESTPRTKKIKQVTRTVKHIRLYKVHGSLNTFIFNNEIVENNYWINRCPSGVEPFMITPGIQKHVKLHEYRHDLLSEYDEAIKKHNTFLFIGFGFNDDQLVNHQFMTKLTNKECPTLIITRDVNEKIERLLSQNKNLWLICKQTDGDENSTMICSSRYNGNLCLDGKQLWNTGKFAKDILGV